MAISTAISPDRVARATGYEVKAGNFALSSPNLPIRIAILGPANSTNQSGLDVAPKIVFSSKEAGDTYGYGSVIHSVMRILRPLSGDGVGGIPTVCYAQADPVGATASTQTITVTASSITKSVTRKIYINGRDNVDGQFYDFSVAVGDTPTTIAQKIADAINNVKSSPVIATVLAGVVTLTTKFKGSVAKELTSKVVFTVDAGDTYALSAVTAGTGTHSITDSLALFGDEWNNIVVNCYDDSSILNQIELFNGNINDKTGRYSANLFKPAIYLFGSKKSTYADIIALTSGRINEMTNAVCPAPLSEGFTYEAAANMAYLFGVQMQTNPSGTISGKTYPDMPVPLDGVIGDMSDYNSRDNMIKNGSSIVTLNGGKYQVENFVTTYHPADEVVPQFQFCRTLFIDYNVHYGRKLLEIANVQDRTLVGSDQVVTTSGTIKPKGWKSILIGYADDLSQRALITDPAFMKESIIVEVSATNPNRLETFFRYKRSGTANVLSTTAEAGFSFNLQ